MPEAKTEIGPGAWVRLHYTITLEEGTVADTSEGGEPLEITLGDGTLEQGLELALIGLKAGDTQTLKIGPENAFGFPDPDGVQTLSARDFPQEITPEPGQIIAFDTPGGDEILGMVKAVEGEEVTVDFNHPLAGHEITFSVEILEVRAPGEA